MEMEIREDGEIKILVCQGRLDAQVSGNVKEKIQQLLDQGNLCLIVDMEEIVFMDSSGLGTLVGCQRRYGEKTGEIKLAGPVKDVLAVFEITRAARLFHICKDIPEALEAFKKAD
jgi:anti-sigma B factor antagonist